MCAFDAAVQPPLSYLSSGSGVNLATLREFGMLRGHLFLDMQVQLSCVMREFSAAVPCCRQTLLTRDHQLLGLVRALTVHAILILGRGSVRCVCGWMCSAQRSAAMYHGHRRPQQGVLVIAPPRPVRCVWRCCPKIEDVCHLRVRHGTSTSARTI